VIRGGSKRKIVCRVIIMGGGLITAAIIALYAPWLYLFDLREIEVQGNYRVSTEQIKQAAGFSLGENLLRTPIERATAALRDLPWIKDVAIRRIYPHALEIVVGERAPIAVMRSSADEAGLLLLAEGGVIVQSAQEIDPSILLVSGARLTGEAPGARLVDDRVVVALAYLQRKNLIDGPFQRIDFSTPDLVIMYGKGGVKIILGRYDGIGERIDRLAALLNAINIEDYRSIDLRFWGEAILAPR